jgi:transposase-like protein
MGKAMMKKKFRCMACHKKFKVGIEGPILYFEAIKSCIYCFSKLRFY